MARTRIKICGTRRPEDAAAAANAGADAVGFVLYRPAPRYVSAEQAKAIMGALPAFVTPVGLFVDESPSAIVDFARQLGLRHVQLHGSESPEDVAALAPLAVLKAIRVDRTFRHELEKWKRACLGGLKNLAGLIVDSPVPTGGKEAGGTGIGNDWNTVVDCIREKRFEGLPPLIAAGGLTPENVGEIVRRIRPWAVDVSSGVEVVRGQKDPVKTAAFIEAVHKADQLQVGTCRD